jgi:MerR family transcriptional regulator, light-induced transcriptional regulator
VSAESSVPPAAGPPEPTADPPDSVMTVEEAYDRYLDAARADDQHLAFDLVERARAVGLDLPTLYLEVLQPALREIGRLWQENELTVAEEHLATAITQSAMLRIYGSHDLREGTGPLLIAACAETERHEIGLRMLCDFLDLEGWETVFLGPSVPAEDLARMVVDRRPDAVALSASITPHLPQLRSTIATIRAAAGDDQPLIVIGGRPFLDQPELAERLGADLCAPDAAEAAKLLAERVR